MIDDKGNIWEEKEYDGYGVFGGKDYYELGKDQYYSKSQQREDDRDDSSADLSLASSQYPGKLAKIQSNSIPLIAPAPTSMTSNEQYVQQQQHLGPSGSSSNLAIANSGSSSGLNIVGNKGAFGMANKKPLSINQRQQAAGKTVVMNSRIKYVSDPHASSTMPTGLIYSPTSTPAYGGQHSSTGGSVSSASASVVSSLVMSPFIPSSTLNSHPAPSHGHTSPVQHAQNALGSPVMTREQILKEQRDREKEQYAQAYMKDSVDLLEMSISGKKYVLPPNAQT
jgi:hypothetical protein